MTDRPADLEARLSRPVSWVETDRKPAPKRPKKPKIPDHPAVSLVVRKGKRKAPPPPKSESPPVTDVIDPFDAARFAKGFEADFVRFHGEWTDIMRTVTAMNSSLDSLMESLESDPEFKGLMADRTHVDRAIACYVKIRLADMLGVDPDRMFPERNR